RSACFNGWLNNDTRALARSEVLLSYTIGIKNKVCRHDKIASTAKFGRTGDGDLISYDGCWLRIRPEKQVIQLEQREDYSNILSKTTRES
ncbi:MAG: hypothetical protein QNJ68_09455, partial [Microcoleaceae cyanobacterium MO_207.B10]|nr:hypothetical protein [Microcoleaceae cyanobacterium MO_207.B10]